MSRLDEVWAEVERAGRGRRRVVGTVPSMPWAKLAAQTGSGSIRQEKRGVDAGIGKGLLRVVGPPAADGWTPVLAMTIPADTAIPSRSKSRRRRKGGRR